MKSHFGPKSKSVFSCRSAVTPRDWVRIPRPAFTSVLDLGLCCFRTVPGPNRFFLAFSCHTMGLRQNPPSGLTSVLDLVPRWFRMVPGANVFFLAFSCQRRGACGRIPRPALTSVLDLGPCCFRTVPGPNLSFLGVQLSRRGHAVVQSHVVDSALH